MNPQPIPHQYMAETAWMLLAQASNDVHHPMRVVTMATVDAKCRPQARLMVLRGANQELGRIWFHTDCDSRKVAEISASPHVAIVAHEWDLGVQLRITGTAKLHEGDAIAQDHWQQVDMTLRHVYGSPGAAEQLPFPDPRLDRLWHHQDVVSRTADRSRFLVIEMQVDRIGWLQAIGARQWKATIPGGPLKRNAKVPPRGRQGR